MDYRRRSEAFLNLWNTEEVRKEVNIVYELKNVISYMGFADFCVSRQSSAKADKGSVGKSDDKGAGRDHLVQDHPVEVTVEDHLVDPWMSFFHYDSVAHYISYRFLWKEQGLAPFLEAHHPGLFNAGGSRPHFEDSFHALCGYGSYVEISTPESAESFSLQLPKTCLFAS